jgi:hypothetical protein
VPQLVKGGKYVFGWSPISEDGGIVIPPEAEQEYRLSPGKNAILISGSKTSGGFVITTKSLLEQSALRDNLIENPGLDSTPIEEGKTFEFKKRQVCRVKIRKSSMIVLGRQQLEEYGIKPGDYLLSVRGSHVGVAMIVKGPLVEYAKKHPEIKIYS